MYISVISNLADLNLKLEAENLQDLIEKANIAKITINDNLTNKIGFSNSTKEKIDSNADEDLSSESEGSPGPQRKQTGSRDS